MEVELVLTELHPKAPGVQATQKLPLSGWPVVGSVAWKTPVLLLPHALLVRSTRSAAVRRLPEFKKQGGRTDPVEDYSLSVCASRECDQHHGESEKIPHHSHLLLHGIPVSRGEKRRVIYAFEGKIRRRKVDAPASLCFALGQSLSWSFLLVKRWKHPFPNWQEREFIEESSCIHRTPLNGRTGSEAKYLGQA